MPSSWTSRAIRSWQSGGRPSDASVPGLFSADALDAFQRDLVVNTLDMVGDAAISALTQAVTDAREEVLATETARSGGIAPLWRQVVDGAQDAPLSAIQPDSHIVIVWNYMPEVARKTYEALVQRSPRLSGLYVQGLLKLIDGQPGDFAQINYDTEQVMFVATVPYARRLEVGKTKTGEPFVHQVAPHIVEETAMIAKQKFGDLAQVNYQYVDLAGSYTLSVAGRFARHFENGRWRVSGTPRIRHGVVETQVRYPAILITPRE